MGFDHATARVVGPRFGWRMTMMCFRGRRRFPILCRHRQNAAPTPFLRRTIPLMVAVCRDRNGYSRGAGGHIPERRFLRVPARIRHSASGGKSFSGTAHTSRNRCQLRHIPTASWARADALTGNNSSASAGLRESSNKRYRPGAWVALPAPL